MPANIHDLPEPVIGLIVGLAGRQAGPATTVVCKQWHSLAWEQPALWSSLTIRDPADLLPAVSIEQWFDHKLALVRRVAHQVSAAEIKDGGRFEEAWLSAVLASFNPGVLTSLHIRCGLDLPQLSEAELEGVARFTGLRALGIDQWYHPLPGASWLPSGLQQLKLRASYLPESLVCGRIAALAQLTSLELTSLMEPLPPLQPLTALPRLRELRADEGTSVDTGMQLLSPLAFPDLHYLGLSVQAFQVPGGVLRSAAHGVDVTVHRRRTAWSLCLYSALLGAVAPLHRVLDALGLGLGRLDSLSFARCSLASAALQPGDVGQLAALRVVKATNCTACAGESLRAALERLLAGCPKLNSITPSNCGLTSLPEGTYVSGLKTCDLSENKLTRVPPALAAAKHMLRLDLAGNSGLSVTVADVDSILVPMARLHILALPNTALPAEVAAHLRLRMPKLRVRQVPANEVSEQTCSAA